MSTFSPESTEDARAADALETQDWRQSLREVLYRKGPERVRDLLSDLQIQAQKAGVQLPVTSQTPYVNTICGGAAAALPRRRRDRAADQEHRPLERHGDGGGSERQDERHRRAHLDLRVRRHPL